MIVRLLSITLFLSVTINPLFADIFRLKNGVRELIPGTEGIEPGPGVQLDNLDLSYALLFGPSALGVDLTGANFESSDLTHAFLTYSTLTDANLKGASVDGTWFSGTNLTQEQLYSTASYETKNVQGIKLGGIDLSAWDFAGQNLSRAWFAGGSEMANPTLVGTDFTGANLTNAALHSGGMIVSGANLANTWLSSDNEFPDFVFDSSTTYNQWTVFPGNFDPQSAGLVFAPSSVGDFDADGALDLDDIEMLTGVIFDHWNWSWLHPMFDLNSNGIVESDDLHLWVKDLRGTWFGDANLDGRFSSGDLVAVFEAGKYEEYVVAAWSEGDWNGDGFFDSSDMVTAFVDGGYEKGLRTDAVAVPEPGGWLLLAVGLSALLFGGPLRRPI